MSDAGLAAIVFVCVFGSAGLGLQVQGWLPHTHRSSDTKDVVKLGTGLIATMAALVLSLLISSSKASFDTMSNEFMTNASRMIRFDRMLADYGPETAQLRASVKRGYAERIERLFPSAGGHSGTLESEEEVAKIEGLRAKLWELTPRTEAQRWLQAQAVQLAEEMMAAHWLLLMQKDEGLPMTLVIVMVAWLSIVFGAFGLFAPRNATVIAALLVCSLSVAGAVFMIEEMNSPFDGLVKISAAPMRHALADLGQ